MDENNVPTDYNAIFGSEPAAEPQVEVAEEMPEGMIETVEAAVEASVEAVTGMNVEVEITEQVDVAVESLKNAVVDIDPIAKLRLREAPDKTSKILAMLTNGTKLKVVNAENPEWLYVEYVDEFETALHGFVNKTYVTMEDE